MLSTTPGRPMKKNRTNGNTVTTEARPELGLRFQESNSADLHVAHAVIDEGILAGLRQLDVEDGALAWREREGRDPRQNVRRVSIGVDALEDAADDVECARQVGTRIDDIQPHALPDFGRQRVVLV